MEGSEILMKQICCTCLSKDRKLFQLWRVPDGVNNLYLLLSGDCLAYKEVFYKDTSLLHICWECRAVMDKIAKFREQACNAQRQLTSIIDGQNDIETLKSCLSTLICSHTSTIDSTIDNTIDNSTEIFIDCGVTDIKTELEDDIPLSKLKEWPDGETIEKDSSNEVGLDDDFVSKVSENEVKLIDFVYKLPEKNKKVEKDGFSEVKTIDKDSANEVGLDDLCYDDVDDFVKKIQKNKKKEDKGGFSKIIMSDSEFKSARNKLKMQRHFVEAQFKCDTCIVCFGNKDNLESHNINFHTEKANHIQCYICQVYRPENNFKEHVISHFSNYLCKKCQYTTFQVNDMLSHVKTEHSGKNGAKRKKYNRPRSTH